MAPRRLDPDDLAAVLPRGGRVLVGSCSAESLVLAEAVARAGAALGPMTFTGVFVPGLNTRAYLANSDCRVETLFRTPQLRAAGEASRFLPLCYADILKRPRTVEIDAALFMATPPDPQGFCGFGPVVDFLAELWPRIPVRIAQINEQLPWAAGPYRIPFDQLAAYVEADQDLLEIADAPDDETSRAIGGHIARFAPDGSTIQTGLGKIPGAALRALRGRCGLKIHSGLIAEAVCDLEDAGALAEGAAVAGGVAIGSRRLYSRVGGPAYRFLPVSHTHAATGCCRILRDAFELAQWAPSNCNGQPWTPHVVSGEKLSLLCAALVDAGMRDEPIKRDFVADRKFTGVHRERQVDAAQQLYGAMGVERRDLVGRKMANVRNHACFDAPHAVFIFIDESFGEREATDIGMWAQALMLALTARGVASCAMGALSLYPYIVHAHLSVAPSQGLLFGVSFGYEDTAAKANSARMGRAAVDDAVRFHRRRARPRRRRRARSAPRGSRRSPRACRSRSCSPMRRGWIASPASRLAMVR